MAVYVDPTAAMRWLLPPVVLPELSRMREAQRTESRRPLMVEVRLEGDRLSISTAGASDGAVSSTGVGLDNLAQRFKLTTGVAAMGRGRWRFVVTHH